jgi:hypothetical protein
LLYNTETRNIGMTKAGRLLNPSHYRKASSHFQLFSLHVTL